MAIRRGINKYTNLNGGAELNQGIANVYSPLAGELVVDLDNYSLWVGAYGADGNSQNQTANNLIPGGLPLFGGPGQPYPGFGPTGAIQYNSSNGRVTGSGALVFNNNNTLQVPAIATGSLSGLTSLIVAGNIFATNVTAGYFAGDGSNLTNVDGNYSNSNVEAYLPTYFGNVGYLRYGNGIAIGGNAGYNLQGVRAIAIGTSVGELNQGDEAIAVGAAAGYTDQGVQSIAIGSAAGFNNQGSESVAIGPRAGSGYQSNNAVAIGVGAGQIAQGPNAIAIGISAGFGAQGINSIAIGAFAGITNQHPNSIILNATGANLESTSTNSFYVSPIRNDSNITNALYYNTTTKEITVATAYSNTNVAAFLSSYTGALTASTITTGNLISLSTIQALGAISGSDLTASGNITATYFIGNGSQLTGLPSQYSNANVANYLPIYSGNITQAGNVGSFGVTTFRGNYIVGNILPANNNIDLGSNTAPFRKIYAQQNVEVGGSGASFTISSDSGVASFQNVQTGAAASIEAGDLTGADGFLDSLTVNTISATGNIVTSANIRTTNYFLGNGAFLTGLPTQYSNANVANYLPIYTGNISANNLSLTGVSTLGAPANVHITGGTLNYYLASDGAGGLAWASGTSNITGNGSVAGADQQIQFNNGTANFAASAALKFDYTANVLLVNGNAQANYFLGNGAFLTGLPSTYSNADVANYLPTYTGNLASLTGNVTTTANVSAGYLLGNGAYITGLPAGYSNANVANFLLTNTGNISANYYLGNGALLTGILQYSNALVADYLPTYTGNLGGTLTSANQSYITQVGNLSSLTVLGNANISNIVRANIVAGNYIYSDYYSYANGVPVDFDNNVVIATYPGTYQDTGLLVATVDGTPPQTIRVTGNVVSSFALEDRLSFGGSSPGNTIYFIEALYYDSGLGSTVLDLNTASGISPTQSIYRLPGNMTVVTSLQAGQGIVIDTTANIGNIGLANSFSIPGNITANYILANGAFITGLPAGYSNANVAGYLPIYNGNILGNTITANLFVGNFQGNITGNLVVPGINTQVLFNNSGNAGADGGFTYDKATGIVGVQGNVNAGGIVTGNITANYFLGNGAFLTGLPSQYSNANVANYLPVYGGNVLANVVNGNTVQINSTGNLTISSNSNIVLAPTGNVIVQGNTSADYYFGNGYYLTGLNIPEGYSNANVANYLPTYTGNLTAGNANINGNVTANYYFGNITLATGYSNLANNISNLQAAQYSNANVANYLPIYTGNLAGGNLSITSNATITREFTVGGNAVIQGNLQVVGNINALAYDDLFIGNLNIYLAANANTPSQANGAGIIANGANASMLYYSTSNSWVFSHPISYPGQYSNSNVASYLPTYTGNLVSLTGNVTTTANVSASYLLGNIRSATGGYNDTNVAAYTGALNNLTGNVTTTANVSASYFLGNIRFATGLNYSNSNVQSYLPTYTGNVGAGNVIVSANVIATGNVSANYFLGNIRSATGGYGNSNVAVYLPVYGGNILLGNANVYGGNIKLTPQQATDFTFLLGPTANVNYTNGWDWNVTVNDSTRYQIQEIGNLFANQGPMFGTVVNVQDFADPIVTITFTTPFDNISDYSNPTLLASNDGIIFRDNTFQTTAFLGYNNATFYGNLTANYFIGNGAYLTGITAGTNYSNANVANYLPTYSGNVSAGNVLVTANVSANYYLGNGYYLTGLNIPQSYSNANVAAYLPTYTGNLVSLTGNVITTANIQGAYLLGNGAFLTGLPATYSNANVANYLAANSNITIAIGTGNITTQGNVSANYFLGNITLATGYSNLANNISNLQAAQYSNANVANYLPTFTGNLTAGNANINGNVIANYYFGNGSALTGLYSNSIANTNMAAYLPTYTGNLVSLTGNVITTANVSGGYILGNGAFLTGLAATYSNANVANYLPTYTGNLANSSDIITLYANASAQANAIANLQAAQYSNSNVANYLPTYTGNLVSLTGNVITTANVTANYFFGNITLATGYSTLSNSIANLQAAQYSNANVANYLPIYSGNISAGNITVSNNVVITGNLRVDGNTTFINANTLVIGDKDIIVANGAQQASDANGAGILVGSTGQFASMIWRYAGNLWDFSGNIAGDIGYFDNLEVIGNITNLGNTNVTGNVSAGYYFGNGYYLTGIQYGNLVGAYGNSNVAAYLPTYTGNLVSLTGNVTTTANVQGAYLLGNGAFITGLPAQYSNANVANYLPTYSGNLASLTGNVITTANVSANYFLGNGAFLTGLPVQYSNANVANYLPTYTGNLDSLTGNVITTANVQANYFLGNGAFLTGLPAQYSNANVANYLASNSNITITTGIANITTQGNITGGYFFGNLSLATGLPNITATPSIYFDVTSNGVNQTFSNSYLGFYTRASDLNIFLNGAYLPSNNFTLAGSTITVSANLIAGDLLSVASLIGNTQPANLTATAAGGNTQIQFNNNGLFSANSSLTYETISGNLSAPYFVGNGYYLTGLNIPASYSNANVANYLPVYSGNISAGNITATGNVSANYFLGNGAFLTGLPSQYSNANVANYLPTYTGNLAGNNLALTNNITANTVLVNNIGALGFLSGNVVSGNALNILGNAIVGNGGFGDLTVYGNVSANYYLGNVAFATGFPTLDNYSNANVASYLASNSNVTITVGTGNITTQGNIAGNYLFGNAYYLTGLEVGNGFPSVTFTANANGVAQTFTNSVIGRFESNAFSLVFQNGVLINSADYTLSGNTLTVNQYIRTGDTITVGPTGAQTTTGAGGNYSNANVAAYLPTYTGNLAGNNISLTGNIAFSGVTIFSATATTANTDSNQVLYQIAASSTNACDFDVVATDDVGGSRQSVKLNSVTYSGTTTYVQYAAINIGTVIGNFQVVQAGGTVQLQVTPTVANPVNYKILIRNY